MKPRPTITQQVEEWLAVHAATVSKKACSLQSDCFLRFWLGTGD
jgi:hypothetical protein